MHNRQIKLCLRINKKKNNYTYIYLKMNDNTSIQNLNDQELQLLIEPTQGCFHPSKKFYRYFSLIFICLLTFGPEGC